MVNLKKHVTLGDILLEVVELFHYLGDKIYPEGGCELGTTAQTRAALGKFRELLPLQWSVKLSDIMSGSVTNENMLFIRVLEWLVNLVGCKM